jgi:hypothetical protein
VHNHRHGAAGDVLHLLDVHRDGQRFFDRRWR